MTSQLAPSPVFKAWDNQGVPLSGGKLFTYVAGTTTKQASFTDSTGGTPNTNPVILNYRGEANVWLDPTKVYKLVLAPANDTDPPTNPFWTVDQISGGILSPTGSIIPTVDNLFTLGNTSFSWANVYVGPNHAPILGASGIVGYYPRTAAEISLSVTPTDFSYPADPYVDPRRYGADQNGIVDSTAAVQTGLNVAYAANGTMLIANACKFLIGAVSVTMSGGKALRVFGHSPFGSTLLAKSGLSGTALLNFVSANPAVAIAESFLKLENFSIDSSSLVAGVNGLAIQGLAQVYLSKLRIGNFDLGINAVNLETSVIDNMYFLLNNTGLLIQLSGTTQTNNLIKIRDCTFGSNHKRGIDYNGGTGLYMYGCDFESNGTAADLTTGGLFLGGNLSPDLLEAHVLLEACWFEGNKGWTINAAAQTNGAKYRLAIKDCELLAAESGREILVGGCTKLHLMNLDSEGGSDTYNLTATYALLENVTVTTLTDTGLSFPTYINVSTSLGNFPNGRVDTFTATLTGCTTSPTGTVTVIQQGDQVTLVFPSITATSNSTACTLTGLPAKYQPSSLDSIPVGSVFDNGVIQPCPVEIDHASGTITLQRVFAAAGAKGMLKSIIQYRLT